MATQTRVSRIQIRRGNYEDLPILADGELGLATDESRLFIGNKPIQLGLEGLAQYSIPSSIISQNISAGRIKYFLGEANNTGLAPLTVSNVSVGHRHITFAPDHLPGITGGHKYLYIQFNSEILLGETLQITPRNILLPSTSGSSVHVSSPITYSATEIEACFIKYTLRSATLSIPIRVGSMSIVNSSDKLSFNDEYHSVRNVDNISDGSNNIEFEASIVDGNVVIQYLAPDNDVIMTFTIELWEANNGI